MTETKHQQAIGAEALQLQEAARMQGWLASARALISGYVDAYTLLSFGVYASFMTGNTTSAGVHVGQTRAAAAGHSLLPIPFFMVGILAGTLLVRTDPRRASKRLSVLVAAMLGVDVVVTYMACPGWFSIMILSSAMGMMNTSITDVGGQAVSVGFMTGDLNNLARQVAMGIRHESVTQAQGPWDTHWHRTGILAALWAAFFIGAAFGALMATHFSVWILLPPAVSLLALTVIERAMMHRDTSNLRSAK